MSELLKSNWSRVLGVLAITAVLSCGEGDPVAPPGSQATKLAFTVQPADGTAGVAVNPAIAVTVQDADGARVTDATVSVTLALGTNPAGAVLLGTKTASAVDGVATFSDISIEEAAIGYTLTASAINLEGATSAPFSIAASAAAGLAFTTEPSNVAAGAPIAPPVEVTVQDAFGNVATSANLAVTLELGPSPVSGASSSRKDDATRDTSVGSEQSELTQSSNLLAGTLNGTTTVTAVNGVATFDDVWIDEVGSGYTITARAGDLASQPSASFNVSPGAAQELTFVTPPTAGTTGLPMTAIEVAITDAMGNVVVGSTAAVSVAIGTNPSGGALSGTTMQNAVNGVATFDDLSINQSGTGYTLEASSTGLTGVTSDPFDIGSSEPNKLAFAIHPSDATAGANISPAVQVEVQDAQGNLVTDATNAVMIDIGTNPAGGALSGTKTVDAVGGVATFSDLSIDKTGAGYTLSVSATGLSGAESDPFEIMAGGAMTLRIKTQPSNATAGQSISPAIEVEILDSQGNLITGATNEVTMAIGANPGGGTLSGTTAKNAVGGVAAFDDLSIDKVGNGYTLAASATDMTGDESTGFDVGAAAPSKLVITAQPSDATAGVIIAPAVVVEIRDDFDNLIDNATDLVVIDIGNNPGGGTLFGSNSKNAVDGVATFDNLSIDKAANGYTLTASSGTLGDDESSGFEITAASAAKLGFVVEPTSAEVNLPIDPALKVEILDDFGNRVSTATDAITIGIGANPSAGSLSGTTIQSAVDGVATFDDLSINRVGSGYTLVADATSLGSDETAAFDIVFLWGSVGLGNLHSCGFSEGGASYCWGDNTVGQVGDGTLNDANAPSKVTGDLLFSMVDGGELHSCALTTDGKAYCWGDNSAGQLGDGTTTNSSVPVAVLGGHTFKVISAAKHGFHTCGITTTDAAYCWGENLHGQLGDGTNTSHSTPTQVSTGLTFVDIDAGHRHTCSIADNGFGYCWGWNSFGQLGNGTTTGATTPQAVSGAHIFAGIEGGRWHSCGVTTANAAFCWGDNGHGQLGDSTDVDKSVPTAVIGGHAFSYIGLGANHSCGLTTGNVAYCWGSNLYGRLGDGTTIERWEPTLVSGGHSFILIDGGQRHTCAVTTAGDAYCWGNNTDGQVGDGTFSQRRVPALVSDPF